MKKKAKLQIYTAANDYFIPTITIGSDAYYVCCDRTEIMASRTRKLIKWTTVSITLHEAIIRSYEGENNYYTKAVAGYITIDDYDINKRELGGKSSEIILNKTVDYLAATLGWNFQQTLSL